MNPTKEQLDKINLYTRRTLTADEVFVFTINLCDTNIDKDYEKFSKESIYQLSELFIGKSGVFDRKNTTVAARIFDTAIIESDDEDWDVSRDYARLNAYAYMVKNDSTNEIIKEIDAGIKNEVSIGCAVDKIICSICGRDMKCNSCEHKKGTQYAVHGFNGKKYATCHHILENPTDAYEWGFVAVPNMRKAFQKERKCTMKKYLIIDTNGDDKIYETENVNGAIYEHYVYVNGVDETVQDAIMAMPTIEKAVSIFNKFSESHYDEDEIISIVDVENALYYKKD